MIAFREYPTQILFIRADTEFDRVGVSRRILGHSGTEDGFDSSPS
jgi:hypothetical protein